MTSTTTRAAALVAACAAALFLSACTKQAESDGHADHQPDSSQTSTAEAAAPADHNAADVSFATMMIPHHEQAVQLADMVPSRSSDPAVVELAAAIAKAQQPEIETMKGFLTQWTGAAPTGGAPTGGHEGHDMSDMQGMVDQATMDRLGTLKGRDFDTLWLQSMISHHEGAIAMAQTELNTGVNADAKRLAEDIVTAQQAEITQMKQMLGG